jgi:hypothetical protein
MGVTRVKPWAALLLAPALLSGCGALGLSSSGPGSAPAPSAPAAGGKNWIVVAQGSPTPSAGPGAGSTGGGWSLPWTPLANGGRAATATVTPTPTCSANTFSFSKVAIADAVAGPTSAVVSWYNVGGYNLRQFRLTAISQDLAGGRQRDVGWVTVPPKTPCGQMSATITGLDRRTGYVFSVDAVVVRRSGDGTHAATVARSHVVRTQ